MFWWLVENHDVVVQSSAGQRIPWATFCVHLADLGLKDRNGCNPKPHTARITWLRARKAVEAATAKNNVGSVHPSGPRPMPRSADSRPPLAEMVEPEQSSDWLLHDREAPMQVCGTAVLFTQPGIGNPPSSTAVSPPEQFPTQSLTEVVRSQAGSLEPVWTTEQFAHRDAVLAKARARLDFTDRFIKLKE